MKHGTEVLRGIVGGGISGLLILGLAFRLLTLLIALLIGDPLNLSLRNVAEVTLVGCLTGMVGGISLVLIHDVFKCNRMPLIACNTVFILLLSISLALAVGGKTLPISGIGLATLVSGVAMAVLYNLLTLWIIRQSPVAKESW